MSCSAASMRTRPIGGELQVARRRGRASARSRRMSASRSGSTADGGRGGDRAGRRRAHGRRDPARLDRARARSGEVRRHAVRRRRRAACRRADPGDRAEVRAGAALSRHHLGARLRASPICATIRCRRSILLLDGLDAAALDRRMVAAARRRARWSSAAGVAVERIDVLYELDMHYLGQTHTVAVPLPVTLQGGTTGVSVRSHQSAFEAAYAASFSRLLPGCRCASSRCAVAAIGRRPALRPLGLRAGGRSVARKGAARHASGLVRRRLARHRRSGRGSICRSARIVERRPSSSSRTPPSSSNPACAAGSTARQSDRGAGLPNDGVIRAFAASTCRTTFCIRTAPMVAQARASPDIAALPATLKPLADLMRAKAA